LDDRSDHPPTRGAVVCGPAQFCGAPSSRDTHGGGPGDLLNAEPYPLERAGRCHRVHRPTLGLQAGGPRGLWHHSPVTFGGYRRSRGTVFYSIPWASLRLSQHPPLASDLRPKSLRTTLGATGTGRTIGQRHRGPSNEDDPSSPGSLYNFPGQGFVGFPTYPSELRFPSARRSDSSRSSSVEPKSTWDMASANSRWPACSAINRCISWATHR
jgi:hypothetical protein